MFLINVVKSSNARCLPNIIAALFVVYLFAALVFPKVSQGVALSLLFVGFGGFISLQKQRSFVLAEKWLMLSFAWFSVVSIVSFFYWPQSRESQMRLEDYGAFLFLLPLYFLLRQYRFNLMYLVVILALMAIFLGVVSIVQYISMKYYGEFVLVGEGRMSRFWLRPSGGVNPMRYAAISLIVACFAFNANLLIANKEVLLKWLCTLAFLMALVACLLAQTRGAWLAFPVLFLVYGVYLFRVGGVKKLGIMVVGVLVLVLVLGQVQMVKSRIAQAVKSFEGYMVGNAQNSMGGRLDMFKAAGILIAEKPVWGHGLGSYSPKASEIRKATPGMSREVGMWNNPHNEILQVMVEKGLIGLITLILLFAAPAYMFIKALYDKRVEVKYYAMNGLAILIVYAVAGQSVALFEHDVFNHFFALMILLFASQISVIQRLGGKSG